MKPPIVVSSLFVTYIKSTLSKILKSLKRKRVKTFTFLVSFYMNRDQNSIKQYQCKLYLHRTKYPYKGYRNSKSQHLHNNPKHNPFNNITLNLKILYPKSYENKISSYVIFEMVNLKIYIKLDLNTCVSLPSSHLCLVIFVRFCQNFVFARDFHTPIRYTVRTFVLVAIFSFYLLKNLIY